ncbi:MAG: type II toxin-antitoxin system VapC family toxin [Polyangiales bacterium]
MSYLLDTCVVSEPTKPRPSPDVIDWLRNEDPESCYLSVLTLGELEKGIERLASGARKRALRRWLETVRAEAADRVIAVDDAIATEWGRALARAEKQGQALPVIDALLGATAIVRGLTVVTRNGSDIARTGAAILDPWGPE